MSAWDKLAVHFAREGRPCSAAADLTAEGHLLHSNGMDLHCRGVVARQDSWFGAAVRARFIGSATDLDPHE